MPAPTAAAEEKKEPKEAASEQKAEKESSEKESSEEESSSEEEESEEEESEEEKPATTKVEAEKKVGEKVAVVQKGCIRHLTRRHFYSIHKVLHKYVPYISCCFNLETKTKIHAIQTFDTICGPPSKYECRVPRASIEKNSWIRIRIEKSRSPLKSHRYSLSEGLPLPECP